MNHFIFVFLPLHVTTDVVLVLFSFHACSRSHVHFCFLSPKVPLFLFFFSCMRALANFWKLSKPVSTTPGFYCAAYTHLVLSPPKDRATFVFLLHRAHFCFSTNTFLFPLTTNHTRSRSHPHHTTCFSSQWPKIQKIKVRRRRTFLRVSFRFWYTSTPKNPKTLAYQSTPKQVVYIYHLLKKKRKTSVETCSMELLKTFQNTT
jgi:hypothetical protein